MLRRATLVLSALVAAAALALLALTGQLGQGYGAARARALEARWTTVVQDAAQPPRPAQGPALLDLSDALIVLGQVRMDCPADVRPEAELDAFCGWLARPGPKRLGDGWGDECHRPLQRLLFTAVMNVLRSGRADDPAVRAGLVSLCTALWTEPVVTEGLQPGCLFNWIYHRELDDRLLGAERLTALLPGPAEARAVQARAAVAALDFQLALLDDRGLLGRYALGWGTGFGPIRREASGWRGWLGALPVPTSDAQRRTFRTSFQACLLERLDAEDPLDLGHGQPPRAGPGHAVLAMTWLPPDLLEQQARQHGVGLELAFLLDSLQDADRWVASLAVEP